MAVKVLDFWATWCPPCNVMKPTIEELEKEMAGKVEFVKYDVDQQGEITQKYAVMSIPTYIIEKDGKEVARASGVRSKEEFKRWVEENL
uniref:Thioredoxin n=1 Tax=candidate division WWE3 bacterium TaxID=2053526 RepID=A0A831YYI3_UNCKA